MCEQQKPKRCGQSMQRPRSMSSKVSPPAKGGLILFFCLLGGAESFRSTFHCGLHCPHRQHHKLSTMHSFSRRPYSRGSYQPTTTSFPTTSSLALSTRSTLSSLKSSNSFILSALLIISSCGIAIEKNTTVGKALSVSYSNLKYT